jgi:hypothetical protein
MKTPCALSSLSLLLGLALTAQGQPVDIRQGLVARWLLQGTDGSITSDADGSIRIQGRRNISAAGGINVFLNALQLIPREIRIRRVIILPQDEMLLLTIEALNPLATHLVEQKIQLSDSDWTDAGAGFGQPEGNIIQAVLPIPETGTRFYRVVEVPTP